MAKTLIAYFSHAGQNYSHGSIRDQIADYKRQHDRGVAFRGDDYTVYELSRQDFKRSAGNHVKSVAAGI